MVRLSFVLLGLLGLAPLHAQVVLNGDLENNTAFGCQWNLPNASFGGLMPNVVAYGAGSEVDIQLNGCNYGAPTPSGQYFISIANSIAATPGDEIYFEVSPPFQAGTTYTLNWIEQANLEFHPQDTLEIGISAVAGTFGTRISATFPPNATWAARSVTFTPAVTSAYITMRNQLPSDAWNFVDNVHTGCVVSADLGNDTTLCTGQSLLLDATANGVTYLWQDNTTGPTMNVTWDGLYWVEVSNGVCTTRDSIQVNFIAPSLIDLGPDTALCSGAALTLDATTPGVTYLWNDGTTAPTLTAHTTGLYWVEVDNGTCTTRDSIQVAFDALAVDLGNDTTICVGTTLVLDATTNAATYLWDDGSTAATRTADHTATYRVQVTSGACMATDSIRVDVVANLPLDLGNDTTLCVGQGITLDATTGGATYQWSTGATSATLSVSTGGSYWVLAHTNTCDYTDTVDVAFVLPPVFSLGNDTAICPYDMMVLAANVAGTLLWSDGSSGTTLAVGPGTYWLEVDDGTCTARDSIGIASIPLPPVDLGPDTAVCAGGSITFDATVPGATYAWSGGGTAAMYTSTSAGSVHVAVTKDGCTSRDTVDVDVQAPPVIDLGDDRLLCDGYELLLDATTPGATYRWNTGATTPAIVAQWPDTFRVEVHLGPCVVRDSVVLFFNELDCACPLYAPNTMTPDGDGTNDGFAPSMPCPTEQWQLRIYDRWGAAIYTSEDPAARWDGTVSGQVVPNGVYVWQLDYRPLHGLETRQVRGSLTVLR